MAEKLRSVSMEQHNYNKQHTLNDLVLQYEAMSQKGTVGFYEETVFSQLIDYYETENAIFEALAVVSVALEQHPYSANLYCKKAKLLGIQERYTVAMEVIEQAEMLSPCSEFIKLTKATLLGELGKYDLAFSILDELRQLTNPSDKEGLAEIYFVEGVLYEYSQNYEATFRAWKNALYLNPTHEDALNRIWICIEISRNFQESIELCNYIINEEPYCSLAWFNLGHAHTYFGDYTQAIEAYEYAFIINPEYEWAYRHCAELCMEIRNYAKALDCFEEVLSKIQPDGELLFKIGQCYYYLNNTKIAQEFFKKSVKLDEINDEVHFYLGECATLDKDWKKAIYFYKRAIEIEGKREEYFAALAKVYIQLNQFEKAFHFFDRAVELAPEQSCYWIDFASFLMDLNAHEVAMDILDDATEFSVDIEIIYCKAVCLIKMGRREEAMTILEEALKEDFEKHPVLFNLLPELQEEPKIMAMLAFYKYEC